MCKGKKEKNPAPYCVSCGKSIESVGGRCIAATHSLCVYKDPGKKFQGRHESRLYKPIIDGQEFRIIIHGSKLFWNDEKVERAIDLATSGYDIWFCQKCTGHICHDCGGPRNYPHGADILYGGHCAALPIDAGCTNTECTKYRDFGPFKRNKPQPVEIKLSNGKTQ